MLPGLEGQISGAQQQLAPGNDYLKSVLGGNYLNSNPYVNQMAGYAGQQAANQVNSTFGAAGRTGGGANQMDLARGVAQGEMQPLMQNYQNERGMQQQAAGMLPNYYASQFSGYQPLAQTSQTAGQLPYYGSQSLNGMGSLFSGYGTQVGTVPGGWGTDLLNAAASAGSAALMASDRRLKRDIVKTGEYLDGLGIYTFRYRHDPDQTVYRGVMADEVKQLRPWAYAPNFRGDGYDGVNYAALQEAA